MKRIFLPVSALTIAAVLTGCGNYDNTQSASLTTSSPAVTESVAADTSPAETSISEILFSAAELEVKFGHEGDPFTLHLYETKLRRR